MDVSKLFKCLPNQESAKLHYRLLPCLSVYFMEMLFVPGKTGEDCCLHFSLVTLSYLTRNSNNNQSPSTHRSRQEDNSVCGINEKQLQLGFVQISVKNLNFESCRLRKVYSVRAWKRIITILSSLHFLAHMLKVQMDMFEL